MFVADDFDDIDEDARFEAKVVIRALADTKDGQLPAETESEDFLLCFGDSTPAIKSSSGQEFVTLALAASSIAADLSGFDKIRGINRDRQGYISCRGSNGSGRVYVPELLAELANDWIDRKGALGRWRVPIRADGSRAGEFEFIPETVNVDADSAKRFRKATEKFSQWIPAECGPLGRLYLDDTVIHEYVIAAMEWWKDAHPTAAWIQTVEVWMMGRADRPIGLIVLPTHPLRVAWQQAFDLLVRQYVDRPKNDKNAIIKWVEPLNGSNYPAMLPGLAPDTGWIFADMLGFHAVAMIDTSDKEPQETVSLLAQLLDYRNNKGTIVVPSVGKEAAVLLGKEISRYLSCHPESRSIHLHALHPGDAMPVARALHHALEDVKQADDDETEMDSENSSGQQQMQHYRHVFNLGLYSERETLNTGRFLSLTAARQRSRGGIPEEDRWFLDSVTRLGDTTLSRLSWSRHSGQPNAPAHLALWFDPFVSRLEYRSEKSIGAGTLEVYGIALIPDRRFYFDPVPRWLSTIPSRFDGIKHPEARKFSERLIELHGTLLRMVAKHLGGSSEDWPVLVTEIAPGQEKVMEGLHRLCDWVITMDRHAGIEYFDSPLQRRTIYDAYLIDCVPERDELGFLQLITSTSSLDEILRLLDTALGEMGLSSSSRNCHFLLNALRAISGRLAMRLVQPGTVVQEMIALAAIQLYCSSSRPKPEPWQSLSLKDGFLVPLDDVPELLGSAETGKRKGDDSTRQRADLIYITTTKSGLNITFIEVKYRRNLATARDSSLIEQTSDQLENSVRQWDSMFGSDKHPLVKSIQRARLVRILRFYARKGQRHTMSDGAFGRINRELTKLAENWQDYPLPSGQDVTRLGFVFCPENGAPDPTHIDQQCWLFGQQIVVEARCDTTTETPDSNNTTDVANMEMADTQATVTTTQDAGMAVIQQPEHRLAVNHPVESTVIDKTAEILLGHDRNGAAVHWSVQIAGNPHLLMVGLPGMGKTTSLIQICRQFMRYGVVPIVFSYHQDIDDKLAGHFGGRLHKIRYDGLGFNPLQVVSGEPSAYLDNAALLRDNFAAIFPDLGDVQLGSIREALIKSYQDRGWTKKGNTGEIPPLSAFYDILRSESKPDKGLMTRLTELADYGLFDTVSDSSSLLDVQIPALIQIHVLQNEALQRAFSIFMLQSIYQSMFQRGPQKRITHAVIFDEAHRAAKLKLIPTMAKECRKYGISLVLASQEVKDFDSSFVNSVANYLTLRVNDTDARIMAKNFVSSDKVKFYTDRIKQTQKHKAWFHQEGRAMPIEISLVDGNTTSVRS
ncbi:MAG: hypothetical protein HQL58_02240 [Magnetococcales bacterium]|nr:hypothetical protein [Magnetococcales bacterium]